MPDEPPILRIHNGDEVEEIAVEKCELRFGDAFLADRRVLLIGGPDLMLRDGLRLARRAEAEKAELDPPARRVLVIDEAPAPPLSRQQRRAIERRQVKQRGRR